MKKLPDEGFDELDKLVPKLLEIYTGVGVNIALINNSQITSVHSYGLFDKENQVPMTKDAVFQLASISKPITAWAVMKLVEEGKIGLDEPVSKYLTRWNMPTDYEKYILQKYCPKLDDLDSIINHDEITIRRLLSHTAGLSVPGYPGNDPEDDLPTIEESLSGESACGLVRVIYPPGSRFSYSGGGYTLLQLLIEEIIGMSFSQFIEKNILQPLGMKNSSFEWRDDLRPKTAKAYSELGTLLPNYRYTALAAAGCYSTVEDLAKFTIASMKGPNNEVPGRSILKPETIELMFTKVMDAPDEMDIPTGIGLGYFLSFPKELPGIKVVQHSGGNTGWSSMMMSIPKIGIGVIILANSNSGNGIIETLLMKWKEQTRLLA